MININTNNYNTNLYGNRNQYSQIKSMLKAVFSSKAVFAIIIFLGIACAANIYIAISSYNFVDSFFDSDSFKQYYIFYIDPEYSIEDFYIGLRVVMNFIGFIFIVFAIGNLWAFIGALTIYLNSKSSNPDTSSRAGFTVLQAFSITKLIIEILPTLFTLFVLLTGFQKFSNPIACFFMVLFVIFNIVKSISLIITVSSIKKTIDGIFFSTGGFSALQFSSLAVGILTAISSSISLLSMFNPISDPSIPEVVRNDILSLKAFFIFCIIFGFVIAIINFLIFIIAKHYSKKLPIAVNAQNVYHANMANLYPDTYNSSIPQQNQQYNQKYSQQPYNQNYNQNNNYYNSPTQTYSQPDLNTYQPYIPPYQNDQPLQPFQTPSNNNNNNNNSDQF